MKTIAYLRVSANSQDTKNQRLEILDYARKNNITIDDIVEIQISSRKSMRERGIDELIERLKPKDCLVVSELSRLGRSVGQIIQIVDRLIKNKVQLIAIKENINLTGSHDMQSKIMVTMIGLFAEIERDLISDRTKMGLAAARARGQQLGRPQGTFNSRLDGREPEIKDLLNKRVSKASIAKILEVSPTTLFSFLKSRRIA